jgi:Domain of unknown function (DUF222)/HNH endonuclease
MFDMLVVEEPGRGLDAGCVPEFADGDWDAPTDGGAPPPLPTLATCVPSGWLALELDAGTADPARLSDEGLIEAVVGFDRVASWAAARQARLLAELARRRPADPVPDEDRASVGSRFVPDEIGVALKLARGTAAGRIGTACRLLAVLPATHALWEAGRIDTLKARAVDEATAVLPDALAAAVEARVLPRAPEQSLPQLRAALARAILAVDPDGAAERHREARKDRRVHVQPEADGMASLWALLTATDAAGAYAWLTRLARGLGKDDPRSMDTRRADLLAELLNGRLVTDVDQVEHDASTADDPTAGSVGRIRPVTPGKPLIQVVVPHSTLIGADDQPAELIGHGPIPADLARETAADAVWRRLVTDPLSGTVLDYGRTTYHPPAGLADHVRVRDQHCRFPLCRRKAADAELDHVVAWADGGGTSATNLQALCVHHHKLKTHTRWRVESHPDGRLTWITPTGHRHTTAPHEHGPPPVGPDVAPVPSDAVTDPDPPPF